MRNSNPLANTSLLLVPNRQTQSESSFHFPPLSFIFNIVQSISCSFVKLCKLVCYSSLLSVKPHAFQQSNPAERTNSAMPFRTATRMKGNIVNQSLLRIEFGKERKSAQQHRVNSRLPPTIRFLSFYKHS